MGDVDYVSKEEVAQECEAFVSGKRLGDTRTVVTIRTVGGHQ